MQAWFARVRWFHSTDQEWTVKEITQLAAELGRRLQVLNAHVTTAESCTGGGIAEAITRIPGSSAWFEAGYVTYSNRQKTLQLNVPEALFTTAGAVSREVVEAMVLGAQDKSHARFAVAVSGIAGPDGGSASKPVGTVWLAWGVGEQVFSEVQHFPGNRDEVRRQTVKAALEGLLRHAAGEISNQG
nr:MULTISPECIES: CinA family protein [unclassified Pseudomonas]